MKRYLLSLLVLLLSACATQATPIPTPTESRPSVIRTEENPHAPIPEDANAIKAGVIVTSLDLSELTDVTPIRTKLSVLGSMPSICNELRIKISPPNQAYEIEIEIYSMVNPTVKCERVFKQFETSILLGEYSTGVYSIWVNSSFVGSIVSY